MNGKTFFVASAQSKHLFTVEPDGVLSSPSIQILARDTNETIEAVFSSTKAPCAYEVNLISGALAEIPKLTEARVKAFAFLEQIDRFMMQITPLNPRAFGKKNAAKILSQLRLKGFLGGQDVRNPYDSCYIGGALVGLRESDSIQGETLFGFCRQTLHDSGNGEFDWYYQDHEPGFLGWLSKQSLQSLAWGIGYADRKFNTAIPPNLSLTRDISDFLNLKSTSLTNQ